MKVINSTRRTLEDYKIETAELDEKKDKSSSNYYAEYLDMKLENSLFILNYSKLVDHSAIENILRQTKGLKIYCSFANRNSLDDVKGVTPVKKNTETFFKHLATSKYIIADYDLSPYYTPREGQCLITFVDYMACDTFVSKTAWTSMLMKSNIITSAKGDAADIVNEKMGFDSASASFAADFIAYDQVADIIKSGSTDFGKQNTNKKKVAYSLLSYSNEHWIPYVVTTLNNIDFNTTDVTLIIDKKQSDKLSNYMKLLKPQVLVVLRTGWFLIKEDMRKTYDYVNTDLPFFENPDDTFEMVDKTLYTRELSRIIGRSKLDSFCVIGKRIDTKNYWINIARSLDNTYTQIVYGPEFYNTAVKNADLDIIKERSITNIYLSFDEILFTDDCLRKEFVEKANSLNIPTDNAKLEVITLHSSTKFFYEKPVITYIDSDYVVYNDFNDGELHLDVIKLPDKSVTNIGIIAESSLDLTDSFWTTIKQLVSTNKDEQFYIFDITGDALESSFQSIATYPNVTYYAGSLNYYTLVPYMDNIVVLNRASNRIEELDYISKSYKFEF